MLAALLLTSCANEEVQEVGHVISFMLVSDSTETAQSDSIGSTRAADGINNDATFVYPAMFTIAADGDNRIYTASAVNTVMTSSAPASFPVSGQSVRVQAFYPAFLMHSSPTPQTFTVAQNQSQTKRLLQSKLSRVEEDESGAIRIYDPARPEQITGYLYQNGVTISEIQTAKIGLEEYYIDLMHEKEGR